jgi:hypothetical protein
MSLLVVETFQTLDMPFTVESAICGKDASKGALSSRSKRPRDGER